MSRYIQLSIAAGKTHPNYAVMLRVEHIAAVFIQTPPGSDEGHTRVCTVGGQAFTVLQTFDTVIRMICDAGECDGDPLLPANF